ncbi:MAG: S8 family serine peptidase, partial [Betaproteobacteria bacterium]
MTRFTPAMLALTMAFVAMPATGRTPAEMADFRAVKSTPAAHATTTNRLIVKFQERASAQSVGSTSGLSVAELSADAGVDVSFVREMSTGARVLRLPQSLPLGDVEAIARKIAARADVEYAEPDIRMYPMLVPNDPQFTNQWHLTDYLGGINAPQAWDITTGVASTVIAVIDTGSTAHPDLDGRLLPSYDFIGDPIVANDGDGRDADASDAGDWVTAAEKAEAKFSSCDVEDSSWHGTQVAAVLGASTQNGRDTAGIDWAARILSVRVLGKCGGLTSDIADGMMWAAGNPVPGVPDNPNPAKILNLSLGGQSSCSNTYRNVITQLVAAGKIIVASAGNENSSADESPASCPGVISVTAVGRSGSKASYASFGSKVTLAAPGGDGGDLITLGNTGVTVAGVATVIGTAGTSLSAPVVSGVISLMLALRPDLDAPAVTRILAASARPFPDSTCDTNICGAGIVDAAAALRSTRDQSLGVATLVGFQDADVGRPNADVNLKVTNLAAGTATIGALSFTGGGDFSATGNTCANIFLTSGSSCNITLRFSPVAKDMRQGELAFSASDGRTYRISLAGFAYPSAMIYQQTAGTSGSAQYIAKAADGNYWYTQSSANRIARMTPAGDVTEFALPSSGSNPFDIVAGADGNMWFTELDAGRIGRISPNGTITEFTLPSTSSQPRGIAAGPDGNIWFTEITTARIGRISPLGVIAEFDIPWSGASPRGIAKGPDGNLWFTDSGGLAVGRVTPSGVMTRFSIPWASDTVRNIALGPDGNLWFTELNGDRIGKVTTAGVFSQFALPRAGAGPLGLCAGPDGAVWYTAINSSRVG